MADEAFPVRFPMKLGAVTEVVATMVPFGYMREYPPPVSQAPSHPAPIQPVAAMSHVTCSLVDGEVIPMPTFPELFIFIAAPRLLPTG